MQNLCQRISRRRGQKSTLEGLKRQQGLFGVNWEDGWIYRYIPELQFVSDHSIEYSVEISKKLNELNLNRENQDEN